MSFSRDQMESFFHVTGPLWGEFTGHRWVTRSFDVFFYLRLDTRWANTGDAGDFGRHRAHYDVTIMCGAMGVIVGKKLTSMSLISAFGHTIICGLAQSQIMGVDTHNYPLQ